MYQEDYGNYITTNEQTQYAVDPSTTEQYIQDPNQDLTQYAQSSSVVNETPLLDPSQYLQNVPINTTQYLSPTNTTDFMSNIPSTSPQIIQTQMPTTSQTQIPVNQLLNIQLPVAPQNDSHFVRNYQIYDK